MEALLLLLHLLLLSSFAPPPRLCGSSYCLDRWKTVKYGVCRPSAWSSSSSSPRALLPPCITRLFHWVAMETEGGWPGWLAVVDPTGSGLLWTVFLDQIVGYSFCGWFRLFMTLLFNLVIKILRVFFSPLG